MSKRKQEEEVVSQRFTLSQLPPEIFCFCIGCLSAPVDLLAFCSTCRILFRRWSDDGAFRRIIQNSLACARALYDKTWQAEYYLYTIYLTRMTNTMEIGSLIMQHARPPPRMASDTGTLTRTVYKSKKYPTIGDILALLSFNLASNSLQPALEEALLRVGDWTRVRFGWQTLFSTDGRWDTVFFTPPTTLLLTHHIHLQPIITPR
jgi:hypothetical protein